MLSGGRMGLPVVALAGMGFADGHAGPIQIAKELLPPENPIPLN